MGQDFWKQFIQLLKHVLILSKIHSKVGLKFLFLIPFLLYFKTYVHVYLNLEKYNQSLVVVCSHCKTENDKDDKFCKNCSQELALVIKAQNTDKRKSVKGEVDLASRNLKKCPTCTVECEITRNICPACDFKFEKKTEPPNDKKRNDNRRDDYHYNREGLKVSLDLYKIYQIFFIK